MTNGGIKMGMAPPHPGVCRDAAIAGDSVNPHPGIQGLR